MQQGLIFSRYVVIGLASILLAVSCKSRPEPEMVSGAGKSLEIPPELHTRPSTTPSASATVSRAATAPQSPPANVYTASPAPSAPATSPALPASATPAFLKNPPPNPAMQGNSAAAQPDNSEEIDTYAMPVDIPREYDGLGGGLRTTRSASPDAKPDQASSRPFSNTGKNVSGREGQRAINLALDSFEYVRQLREPSEQAQAEIDAALGTLMQNAVQKFDGKIDQGSYLARLASGKKKLQNAFDRVALNFENIDQRLLQSPLHNTPQAQTVRSLARAEQMQWQNAIWKQVDLFEQHANGITREDLRVPSIVLFFPYLKAKSQHMAAAYQLEASSARGLSSYNMATTPGGVKDLLTSLSTYNQAFSRLIDAVSLTQCTSPGRATYKARNPGDIIPALNALDKALSFIPGLDREALGAFTPILINNGVNESEFIAIRGPLSKALNDLEVATLSRLARGFEPIFGLIEAGKDPSACEGDAGVAVTLADGLTQIGSISLEEIIDPERAKVFKAAREFYFSLENLNTTNSSEMISTQRQNNGLSLRGRSN